MSIRDLPIETKMQIARALTGDTGYINVDMEKSLMHEVCRRLSSLMEIKELKKEQMLEIFEDWSALVVLKFIENAVSRAIKSISSE